MSEIAPLPTFPVVQSGPLTVRLLPEDPTARAAAAELFVALGTPRELAARWAEPQADELQVAVYHGDTLFGLRFGRLNLHKWSSDPDLIPVFEVRLMGNDPTKAGTLVSREAIRAANLSLCQGLYDLGARALVANVPARHAAATKFNWPWSTMEPRDNGAPMRCWLDLSERPTNFPAPA